MNTGKTVFSQVMEFLPLHEFRKCVERYQGNYKVISFSCLDQFLCMAFAQLTYRESLRDMEACLRSARDLYLNEPLGIDLEQTVYALDATTIDLCLSLFPWAHFQKNKGTIKLHTLLD